MLPLRFSLYELENLVAETGKVRHWMPLPSNG
jgi:hypothetical protein